MRIRPYEKRDLDAVQRIHEATGIDYRLPDLSSPLFVVTKVLEDDQGMVRMAGGLYLQVEAYLWSDSGDWCDPATKLTAISALDGACCHEAWLRGIDCCCLWLPPGYESFGKRLVEDLGFTRDRAGWVSYSKKLTG